MDQPNELSVTAISQDSGLLPTELQLRLVDTGELFDSLFEQLPVGFAVTDMRTGRILRSNLTLCEILGRSRFVLNELTWLDVTHPDDRILTVNLLEQMNDGQGQSFRQKIRFVRSDGSSVPAEVTIALIGRVESPQSLALAQVVDLRHEASIASLVRLVSDQPTGDVLAHSIAEGVLHHLNPISIGLYFATPKREALRRVGTYGYGRDLRDLFELIPMDAQLPITEVFRTGIEQVASVKSVLERYPMSAAWGVDHKHLDSAEYVQMPIQSRGVTLGVLGIEFPTGLPKTWESHVMLESVAAVVALWENSRPSAERTAAPAARVFQISERQRSIIRLVRKGLTNKQIGNDLGFSEGTIRSELGTLGKILAARGRAEIADKATKAGV